MKPKYFLYLMIILGSKSDYLSVIEAQSFAYGQVVAYDTHGYNFAKFCGEGCLRCDYFRSLASDIIPYTAYRQCTICDWQNGYAFEVSGHCIKNSDKNCFQASNSLAFSPTTTTLINSAFAPCQICKAGFFPDFSGVCVKLDKNLAIANCMNHTWTPLNTLGCAICNVGFGLVISGTDDEITECVAISASAIPNCEWLIQGTPDQCMKCKKDFLPTSDNFACIPKKVVKNCALWATDICTDCATGYIPNLKNNQSIADHLFYETALSYFHVNYYESFFNQANLMCQRDFNKPLGTPFHDDYGNTEPANESIQNCLFRDPNNGDCTYCVEEYVLDTTKLVCSRVIENCKNQFSSYQCLTCAPNYILSTSLGERTQIDCVSKLTDANCKTFGTFVWTDPITNLPVVINGCTECKPGFYTADGSICLARTVQTACKTFHLYKDECTECKAKLTVTITGECVTEILNCVYATEAKTDCELCDDGYFYNSTSKTCVKNTIVNCIQQTENECIICDQGFNNLNSGQVCEKSPVLPNCLRMKDTSCIECETGYFMIGTIPFIVCRKIPDANCVYAEAIIFDGGTTTPPAPVISMLEYLCVVCKPGFVLTQNNCSKESDICKNNSFWEPLFEECIPRKVALTNCAIYNSLGECDYCKENYKKSGASCIPRSTADIADCLYYNSTGCAKCVDGNYISATFDCTGAPVTPCGQTSFDGKSCLKCTYVPLSAPQVFYLDPTTKLCVDKTADLPTNCNLMDSSNKCLCCAATFSYNSSSNTCVTAGAAAVANCLCQVGSICTQCLTDYINVDGKCVQSNLVPDACILAKTVNPAQCVGCKLGFELTSDGECVKNYTQLTGCQLRSSDDTRRGTCAYCETGFYQDQYSNCRTSADMTKFFSLLDYAGYKNIVPI